MRTRHPAASAAVLVLVQLCLAAAVGFAQAPPIVSSGTDSDIIPGRVIVKYRQAPSRGGRSALHQAAASQPVTGAASLESIHRRFHVQKSDPLFRKGGAADMAQASADFMAEAQSVKMRFPQRARRAPSNAVIPDLSGIFVLEVSTDTNLRTLCDELAKDPNVEYAVPDRRVHLDMVPNDTYWPTSGSWGQSFDDLWHLKKIQADKAWDIGQGAGVVVGVVDSGVDYNHPDIAANMWSNPADGSHGWNFNNGTNDPMDTYGHGTHVAGIIAAVGNNGAGVIGVAPKAKIMAVNIISNMAAGYNGIKWAVDHGAEVINCSFGSNDASQGYDKTYASVLDYATAHGVVVVASAGNDALPIQPGMLAVLPNIIGVAATTPYDKRATWSNYGSVSLGAPGGGDGNPDNLNAWSYPANNGRHAIISLRAAQQVYYPAANFIAIGSQYMRMGGTSMSAPMVTGAAALVLSVNPTLTVAQVRSILENTADNVGDATIGHGRLNAYKAVLSASGQTPVHHPPIGYHDASDCVVSAGWTCGPDDFSLPVTVNFYADGPVGQGTLVGSTAANAPREAAVGAACGGYANHGFTFPTPASLKDGRSHALYAYAVDPSAANNPLLGNSPKTITCAAAVDTTPPSVPQNLRASLRSPQVADLSWSPSTDNVGVAGYYVFLNGSLDFTTAAVTSYERGGLAAATAYTFTVAAYDAAGNVSAQSAPATVVTPAPPDTTPPTVSITSPANGATVSGTVYRIP